MLGHYAGDRRYGPFDDNSIKDPSGPVATKPYKESWLVRVLRWIGVILAFVLVSFLGVFVAKWLNQQLQSSQKFAQEQTQKMVSAQEEANQERIAKNQKALELAQKEQTERELNADKDRDGLTNRQEISYGTSDNDTDSDDDGIPDGQDMHPAGGGSNMAQTFAWNYGGYNYTFTTAIPEDWFFYYKNKQRLSPENIAYVTYEDKFVKEIANKVLTEARGNSFCESCLAAAFIQSLPYVKDVYTGYDEYPKYPLETLFEKNGDCEDTSYLTAAIIRAMNIDTVLVLLPGHMAVAVWADCTASGTYYKVGDRCYYYLETTGDGFKLGDVPDDYKYASAKLLKMDGSAINNVAPQYKKPCYSASDAPGYYSDGKDYYSDSQCYNIVYCIYYKGYYFATHSTDKMYWDSNCSQQVLSWCPKSTNYPGYFYSNISHDIYNDSQCTQRATLCRASPNYSDTYYDGYNEYWDSSCTQRVVPGCSKSSAYPGYFFNGVYWYLDYQCTQKATPR